jgi:aldehyde:ferredoxin oxidoreductase
MVAGKSPLTNTWGDANSGGIFGPEIKKCGYDAILFRGVANEPKYISIIEDRKEILNASGIWGLNIIKADLKLKKNMVNLSKQQELGELGKKFQRFLGLRMIRGALLLGQD